jgi:hypothetical protein
MRRAIFSHFGVVCRFVDIFCKLLKTRLFNSEILLDTPVLRLIRFPQKVLMVFKLRWNYSPLKEKAAQVAGWPFRLQAILSCWFSVPGSQFLVLSSWFSVPGSQILGSQILVVRCCGLAPGVRSTEN